MATMIPAAPGQALDPGRGVYARQLSQKIQRTPILHEIDLAFGTGVFGLLGPNGAGKTTLLRTLATILTPWRGELRLLGRDLTAPGECRAVRRRLGYLPQLFGYYPNFTVFEFVEYFALLKELPAREVRPAVVRALGRVGLEGRARAKLRTLSGGMLRRVGIAQAIVNEPELLLLDEPTVGLDPDQRIEFRGLLRELGQRSAVVLSTHLVEDVGASCDRVAVMNGGRIVFSGAPAELITLGAGQQVGDSPLERGYSAAIRGVRR